MSIRVCVLLLAVIIGAASALKSTKAPEKKGQCVDNTLYAKYLCKNRPDGEKNQVPGKCGEYYECSKGESIKKSCPKFFDSTQGKCVSESKCIEVDDTNCVIPTPPPCNVTPMPPAPCDCPSTPVTPSPPTCPTPPTCPPPTVCPKPPTCPPPTQCPKPEPCPGPTPKPPCLPPSGGPCGTWFDPEDLYGSFLCRNKPDHSKFIALNTCSEYYYCLGGHFIRKSCGKNRYYNPVMKACDEKENVDCPSDMKVKQ